jgi:hypothetical protein
MRRIDFSMDFFCLLVPHRLLGFYATYVIAVRDSALAKCHILVAQPLGPDHLNRGAQGACSPNQVFRAIFGHRQINP